MSELTDEQKAAEAAAAAEAEAKAKAEAKPEKITSGVIWVQPGHQSYAVGQFVPCAKEEAIALQERGFARVASKEEVAHHIKHKA